MAVAGLVLGIVAVVFAIFPCTTWFSSLLWIPGLVLSIIAMVKAKKANMPSGKALAGIILNGIAIVIGGNLVDLCHLCRIGGR